MKWSIRAALFPAPKVKNPCRTTNNHTEDEVNYSGIAFPTPFKGLEKLEAQNENVAIIFSFFGWNGRVTVYRITENQRGLLK